MRKLVVAACCVFAAACSQPASRPDVMVIGGDADRGRLHIDRYGCGTCHTIPGIQKATGRTGPPLTHWTERAYIAGSLINNPTNLVAWIMFPDSVEPGTAMPTLGLSRQEASDVAAYLFTIEDAGLAGPPYLLPVRWLHDLMPRHAKRAH